MADEPRPHPEEREPQRPEGDEAETEDAGRMAEQALDSAQGAVDDLKQGEAADRGEGAAEDDAAAGAGDGAEAEAGDEGAEAAGPNVELPSFQKVLEDVEASGIDLLHDVELNVKIELGRTHMLVEDVLRLNSGSVVELDKLAGDPVDIFVNERLVARGEVLVLNDNFCVRVSEIVADLEEAAEGDEDKASSGAAGEPVASQAGRSTGG